MNFAKEVHELCNAFCDQLKKDLTPEQLVQVIARNTAETDANICHTHDFIDGNETMNNAYKVVFGTEPELLADDRSNADAHELQTDIVNMAWLLAKANNFKGMAAKLVEATLDYSDPKEPKFSGYLTVGNRYLFTKEQAGPIMTHANSVWDGEWSRLNWDGDVLVVHDIENDITERLNATAIIVDGQTVYGYAIGDGNWSWEH